MKTNGLLIHIVQAKGESCVRMPAIRVAPPPGGFGALVPAAVWRGITCPRNGRKLSA